MRFGSLVGVRDRPIRRELCRSLMEQFDVEQCIAKYGDFSFPLGISCAAVVLRVENKGKSVVKVSKSKNRKALASKYGLKQKVTYAELEEEIKSGSYGGDKLKARVRLYLVGIFLCPTGDTSTNKDYMKIIYDEGLKGEFNWAEYVHSRLIESIITFKKGSQRYLKGCITILEVALFDFWSGCEAVPAYERTRVAHIRAWGKEEVVRVMVKLKLDRPRKQERVIGKGVIEAEKKEEDMVVLGDDMVKEVVELRSEVTGVKGVVDEYLDEGKKLKGEIKKMNNYVEQKYDELKKYEEEKKEEEEKMEEMRRKDVDVIYTPESVIDADLDSECPAPQKKKQKVEKADIPSGIDDLEAVILCYDSKKPLRRIGYLLYHLAALDANKKVRVEDIATFWGPILGNYVKFTDCEKIMITINYNNSHWYMLVLDMVDRVATIYDNLFISEAAKQRVNDSKILMKILDSYNKKRNWVEACGSPGKFPLKNFKFVEHKMNEQVNGYDCGMYVMMRMESIGYTGVTDDFVVGQWDRSRILNDLIVVCIIPNVIIIVIMCGTEWPFHIEVGWKRVKDVGLDQEREEMDPIGHEDDQLIGDAMMEEAPEAPVGEDVTVKTVMKYMVNFWEHIDSLVNVDNQEVNEDEDDDEDDDDDDPNKYIVSATPLARKLVIFYVNGVLAYFPRQPKGFNSILLHNINPVLEKLPLLSDHFLFTWDQPNCKTYDNVTYCKDLNDVWNAFPYFNDLNTLLVDDSAEKMIYNMKYNYICPHSFYDASYSGDNALEKGGNIREYLENLLKAPNIPDFVKNNPFSSD
ncbi:hypothetical protein F3Y22_tig00110895pilonHSYRG00576 [Hibiscus syriacus]|uniref:Ubiquitin-like protease family profile domain-containing protein n=1 Tax=Hibiscus syriacus TaxID=106335 RepID=A0A6A2ZFZ5_HIBSY|nr:hypothetical protein F3Y22_tig00110895pilonHSYRG00576 [Hibiscus syriacus]